MKAHLNRRRRFSLLEMRYAAQYGVDRETIQRMGAQHLSRMTPLARRVVLNSLTWAAPREYRVITETTGAVLRMLNLATKKTLREAA